jgi:hypothetical protein
MDTPVGDLVLHVIITDLDWRQYQRRCPASKSQVVIFLGNEYPSLKKRGKGRFSELLARQAISTKSPSLPLFAKGGSFAAHSQPSLVKGGGEI